MIKIFDFGTRTVTRIMGGTSDGYTADRTTPGWVRTATLWNGCHDDWGNCFAVYRTDDDRLYFSEDYRVRFITAPRDPSMSTLGTLFERADRQPIQSFTFHPSGTQLFYVSGGSLHCHDLGSGAGWCNDTPLGPPAILAPIEPGPNQLTWRGDRTLLISSYAGEVYEHTLAP